MSNIVCPYCFESFASSDVLYRCSNESGCRKTDDPELHRFWGRPVMELPVAKPSKGFAGLFGKMPEEAKCPECSRKTYTVICPHCHNRLPKDMVRKRGYIISIVGARSSGKTIYITTLIEQLRRHCAALGDVSVMASAVASLPKQSTDERYIRDFYNVIYRNSELPQQTKVGDEASRVPLIYELKQAGKTPVHLVLYDTAGENFHDVRDIERNVKFLRESDAMIFLLDTFAIPQVHRSLAGPLRLPTPEYNYDLILSKIISFFNEGDKGAAKEHFKKPIALTFSKIDALVNNPQYFGDTSISGMSMDANSSFLDGSGVNMDDIESVSASLQAALAGWGETGFLTNINAYYSNASYFGISALGDNPDIRTGKINNLRPYRVLDPVVWVLTKLGYKFRTAK